MMADLWPDEHKAAIARMARIKLLAEVMQDLHRFGHEMGLAEHSFQDCIPRLLRPERDRVMPSAMDCFRGKSISQRTHAMDFAALDFETVNADLASICQIGVAGFEDGQIRLSRESRVNPGDYFNPFHLSIHGITESMVQSSPMAAGGLRKECQTAQSRSPNCEGSADSDPIRR